MTKSITEAITFSMRHYLQHNNFCLQHCTCASVPYCLLSVFLLAGYHFLDIAQKTVSAINSCTIQYICSADSIRSCEIFIQLPHIPTQNHNNKLHRCNARATPDINKYLSHNSLGESCHSSDSRSTARYSMKYF